MAAGSVAACWWEFSDRWPPGRYPSRQSRRGRRPGIRRGVRCPRPGRRTVRRTCRVMPHRRPQPLREATDCQHEDEQLAVQGDHRVVVGQNAPCLRGIAGCDGSAALATPAARTHDRSPHPRHLRVVVSSIQSAAAADRMSGLANNGAKVFAGTTTRGCGATAALSHFTVMAQVAVELARSLHATGPVVSGREGPARPVAPPFRQELCGALNQSPGIAHISPSSPAGRDQHETRHAGCPPAVSGSQVLGPSRASTRRRPSHPSNSLATTR